MKKRNSSLLVFGLLTLLSCKQEINREITDYDYFDVPKSDTVSKSTLVAATDEKHLQFGRNVTYLNLEGDTIIPLGKYAYFGTDTLKHYATVLEHPHDSAWGRQLAIDQHQHVLFDVFLFDNGPDYFKEGLTRALRNGKMGYANKYGQVVIPCIYDFASPFEQGKAQVTFDALEYLDLEEHMRVESDDWFYIDKQGKRINE